jgi:hyperosmotically inducible periplasmic protein
MKNNTKRTLLTVIYASALTGGSVFAQEHQWAGRTLDNFEWSIHERLAGLPSYGVFDTIRFEVQGHTVNLSGQVTRDTAKHAAARAVGHIAGVDKVVNKIEVLPTSRSDDALRKRLYRAIYEDGLLQKYGTEPTPPVHLIVKNGWLSLEGVVDSDADRHMVYAKALQVTAQIRDNLRVGPRGRRKP